MKLWNVEQDYIHKVPVILHDNLQRESHKPQSTHTHTEEAS